MAAAPPEGAPLPSTPPVASPPPADAGAPALPPVPQFKFSTSFLMFLFFLGIIMLFDTSFRNGVAAAFGYLLMPLIGFDYRWLLLTMFLAALIEMALTALAYNWATDWVKTSRIASWSSALRKVQMEALRSGKKDRINALKSHQAEIQKLSSDQAMSQLKGMAVTWFLVIAIYTWVGLFLLHAPGGATVVNLGGSHVDLLGHFLLGPFPIPYWIVLFSLYTFPLSYVLRRALKHYSLRQWELTQLEQPLSGPPA